MKFNLNFLKGIGNEHVELSRLVWFIAVIAGIGFTGWQLYLSGRFDIQDFGTGFLLLNSGGGAATAGKDIAVAKAKASIGGTSQ